MKLTFNSTSFVSVKDVQIPDIYNRRLLTDIPVIDKMFGGGLLPGSVLTFCSRAGLGKTTFVLQILEKLALKQHAVGFCSSEESVFQVAFNCKRIGIENVGVCNESKLSKILSYIKEMEVVVIDSFQGLDLEGKSDKQAIESIIECAKEAECVVVLICHMTKGGDVRGTNLLTYAVDVNVFLDLIKDGPEGARNIYITKNRFGPGADFDCMLTQKGFDFTVLQQEKNNKTKKETQRESILAITGKINIENVCTTLNVDSTRAMYLLRELTNENRLIKKGTGKKAYWKQPKQTVEITQLPGYYK
jgi:predicted ATP-dependent serine protease